MKGLIDGLIKGLIEGLIFKDFKKTHGMLLMREQLQKKFTIGLMKGHNDGANGMILAMR